MIPLADGLTAAICSDVKSGVSLETKSWATSSCVVVGMLNRPAGWDSGMQDPQAARATPRQTVTTLTILLAILDPLTANLRSSPS